MVEYLVYSMDVARAAKLVEMMAVQWVGVLADLMAASWVLPTG